MDSLDLVAAEVAEGGSNPSNKRKANPALLGMAPFDFFLSRLRLVKQVRPCYIAHYTRSGHSIF